MSLFQFYFLEFSAIYILVGWAVYLMFRINQPYFGALYSMCIGAYFAAFSSINWGWPFWLILVVAVVLCIVFSLVTAFRLARLGPFAMVIASMGILLIIQTAVKNIEILGGHHGLFGIAFLPMSIQLGITYCFLMITGYCIYRLDYSHIGRAMDAVHFDRDIASSMGVNVCKLSVQFQVISCAIGGIAGVLYAFTMGGVFPEAFDLIFIMHAMTMVVFGGMYTMWGIIIAAPVLWGFSQFLPEAVMSLSVIIYGVLLIVMLLARPSGIIDRKMTRAVARGFAALGRRAEGPPSKTL